MVTIDRMPFILAAPDWFDLFTDHQNLIFLFDPLAVVFDLSQTSLRKLFRWAVRLSAYNYTYLHIKSAENVWTDLLGLRSFLVTIRWLVNIPILPSSLSSDFDCPTSTEIARAQERYCKTGLSNLHQVEEPCCNPSNAVWIPGEVNDLKFRLCILRTLVLADIALQPQRSRKWKWT